jgi:hypothetical protein
MERKLSPINAEKPKEIAPPLTIDLPGDGVVDQETGEITTVARIVEREVAKLPEDLADLRGLFQKNEPTPREVMGWIMARETMEQVDPEDAQLQIIARILMAESAEDVLAQDEVKHARDVLAQPFRFMKVQWQRSEMEQGSACYAVIHAQYPGTNAPLVITTGAKNVMVQLLKMDMIGAFPFEGKIVQKEKATAAGFHPLYLTHL